MRLAVILIAAAAMAAPAFAQDLERNGPDPTGDQAVLLEQQRMEADLARQALSSGDFKTARKYATGLTGAAPQNVSTWLMLGEAQRGMEDWKSARRTYAKAVRVAPTNVEAHAGLGVALARTGDAAAARQLEWLNERAKTCGAGCGSLPKLKSDVEAAIAAKPTGG